MSGYNNTSLSTEIVINATPRQVREVLLDFDRWPEWKVKQNIINHLRVERAGASETIKAIDARVGDLIKINSVQSGNVEATVTENMTTRFGYEGVFMAMRAHHYWEFLPLPSDPGKTLFKNCEDWNGGIAFLFMAYSPLRPWVAGLFAAFNEDVRARAEAN